MPVQCVVPILNVSDLAESFRWFERLGWRKLWDWGDPPDFGAVGSGGAEIFLCLGKQGDRGTPLPADPNDPWSDVTGTWMSWMLSTPAEVDALHALAVRHGMTVTWPPTDMPWNMREFHVRHPDGHTMRVGAGLAEE